MEAAIEEAFGEKRRLRAAGRTDAGVHAAGQVAVFDIAFRIPAGKIAPALEMRLPPAIRIRDSAEAASDFDPRGEAHLRRYRYRLAAGRRPPLLERAFVAWHPYAISFERLRAATKSWAGARDLASFVPLRLRDEARMRDLTTARLERRRGAEGMRFEWVFEAPSFLQHQVRTMVGTLLEIARRAKSPRAAAREAARILAARDRREAGPPAEARGLVLESVLYPRRRDPFR